MKNKKENLVPAFSDPAWRTNEPPYKKNAEFSVSPDGRSASIKTADDFGVGKWICSVPVSGGAFYDFSASCKTELPECDAYLIITQFDEKGKMPIREHVKDCVRDGEYLRFSDKLDIAEQTVRLEIELWCKGSGAFCEWDLPTLTLGEPLPKRTVRLAAIQMKWNAEVGRTKESQFEAFMSSVEKVGERGVDLIVLGEGMYSRGLGISHPERARIYDPEMIKALGEKAVKYSTYIIYNGVEEEKGNFYNASFIIDRTGKVVGTYRKTHITVGEYEGGLTPGVGFPVFDLDFGRIGILICYDQFFPETAKALVNEGAEIIAISTAGDDHHACMSLAIDSGVYLAVSGMNMENDFGWGPTRIVDPLGNQLSHTNENLEAAYAEIDLNKKVRRFWMSTGPALSSVHDDYRYEVNPHSFEN
ncbi:MAG: carbon-nitrogen hydrolase family protein [Clostridia bacterium]|nr:carbon-nitrogen hydrolase family protein [Clostridia bacterium]